VRQWLLVLLKPHSITHVEISAAEQASLKVFGLGRWRSGALPTDDDAARARFIEAGNLHQMLRSKNQAPELLPRPDP
jgi:hypothetical protein